MALAPSVTYLSADGLVPSRNPNEAHTDAVVLAPGTYVRGQALGEFTARTAAAEVQTLTFTGTPTGGTFRLGFNGQITGAITYSTTNATLEANILAALIALSNIGTGNVTVSSATSGTVVTITFAGVLANINQPMITFAVNGLTGGSTPTATVAETTPGHPGGVCYAAYNDSLSNGLQVFRALNKYDVTVDEQGRVQGPGLGLGIGTSLTTPAYFSGTFYGSAVTGLDANGIADCCRMIVGVSSSLSTAGTEFKLN